MRLKSIIDSRLFRKIYCATFFALVSLIHKSGYTVDVDPEHKFLKLVQFIYRKQMFFFTKLSHPKEPILAVFPLIIARAITIAFSAKISEQLSDLIICSDATAIQVAAQIKEWKE